MADPNIKPDARQLIESLPDSATWDDLAYQNDVRQAIELGLADADAGRTVEHDEAGTGSYPWADSPRVVTLTLRWTEQATEQLGAIAMASASRRRSMPSKRSSASCA